MQIKHKITLVYTLMVSVILLLLCGAIYFFSVEDKEHHFEERLYAKALSTAIILESKEYDLVEKINETAPSALHQKSLLIYDLATKRIYNYNDDGAVPIKLTKGIVSRAESTGKYFFNLGGRDAVAIKYKDNAANYIVVVAAYDESRMGSLSKLRTILAICFICAVGIVFISGYLFSLSIVGQISGLTHKVNHISTEAITERLDVGEGKDELQQLAATINKLLDRLQISFDTQRRFISNASHELATPLTAITSQLDVALQKDRSSDEYRNIISSVRGDVKKMALLLSSLLEIARASGSEGGIELSSVRIDELLMTIPSDIRKISPLYDVIISFEDFPDNEDDCVIYGNRALLGSAIKNVVHNACKFSKDKTALVKLWFNSDDIFISVADKGPGISPEDYDKIFQPFFRGYRQDNQIYGTGLGLALAKRIVDFHKGDMDFETMVGRGTTFYIKLPMMHAPEVL